MRLEAVQKYKKIEVKDFYLLMAATGHLLWKLEQFEGSRYRVQAVKAAANRLYTELDNMEGKVAGSDTGLTKEQEGEAMQQMIDSYTMFENWFNCLFDVPAENHDQFSDVINVVVQHFKGHKVTPAQENALMMLKNSVRNG